MTPRQTLHYSETSGARSLCGMHRPGSCVAMGSDPPPTIAPAAFKLCQRCAMVAKRRKFRRPAAKVAR